MVATSKITPITKSIVIIGQHLPLARYVNLCKQMASNLHLTKGLTVHRYKVTPTVLYAKWRK